MPFRLTSLFVLLTLSTFAQTWTVYKTSNSPLYWNRPSVIIPGDSGGVWVACKDYGALQFFRNDQWTTYTKANSVLEGNPVNCLTRDRKGYLWVGQVVVYRYDGRNWRAFTEKDIPDFGLGVSGLLIDKDGALWVLHAGGLTKYDGSTWTTFGKNDMPMKGGYFTCLARDSSSNILIGSRSGLFSFDGTTWKHRHRGNSSIPFDDIWSVAVDKDGSLWVSGITGTGVAQMVDTTWTRYTAFNSPLPDDYIYSVNIARDGTKWFGTHFFGAVSFDGANWRTYDTTNSGLPSNGVSFTMWDEVGNQWFACRDKEENGTGIVRYGLATGVRDGPSEEQGTLFVFPTLARFGERVTISTNGSEGMLRIFDSFGRNAFSQSVESDAHTIQWTPSGDAARGVYFVTFLSVQGVRVSRLVLL